MLFEGSWSAAAAAGWQRNGPERQNNMVFVSRAAGWRCSPLTRAEHIVRVRVRVVPPYQIARSSKYVFNSNERARNSHTLVLLLYFTFFLILAS